MFRSFVIVLLSSTSLWAGVQYKETTVDHREQSSMVTQIWLQDGLLRVEEMQGDWIFFHDSASGEYSLYDKTSRRASRISAEELKGVKDNLHRRLQEVGITDQQLAQAQDVMQSALAEARQHMSAEEQATMDRYLGSANLPGMGSAGAEALAAASEELSWEKAESNVKIRGIRCDHYRGLLGGELVQEVWSTTPNALDMHPEEAQVIESMNRFVAEISGESGPEKDGYKGIPVREIAYEGGQPSRTSDLEQVGRPDLESTFLKLPAGAQIVPLMDLVIGGQ